MHAEFLNFFRDSCGKHDLQEIAAYLEAQFLHHQYFLQLGKETLLFMNPGTPYENGTFSKGQLDVHLTPSPPKSSHPGGSKPPQPHIFQMAANVYTNMLLSGQNQTIFLL